MPTFPSFWYHPTLAPMGLRLTSAHQYADLVADGDGRWVDAPEKFYAAAPMPPRPTLTIDPLGPRVEMIVNEARARRKGR